VRRKERLAFGCIAALLLACLVAAGVAYVTGWLTHIKNTAAIPFKAQSLIGLSKQYPFVPPDDACVTEERLLAFLEICRRVKPFADKLDTWEEEHRKHRQGKRTGMKMEAAGLVVDFMNELAAALEDRRMGPSEFCWIDGRMRRAARGEPASTADGADRDLYVRYAGQIEACFLGEHSLDIADDFAESGV